MVSCLLQSDPDLPQNHSSPSPTDEVFHPATAPPPYMAPQPSIEEARQQMHSLLDDAFALVSPSSQGSAGVSGVSPALPSPSPQAPPPTKQWGSYPVAPSHSPFSAVSLVLQLVPHFVCWTPFDFHCPILSSEIRRAGNFLDISSGSDAQVTLTATIVLPSLANRVFQVLWGQT